MYCQTCVRVYVFVVRENEWMLLKTSLLRHSFGMIRCHVQAASNTLFHYIVFIRTYSRAHSMHTRSNGVAGDSVRACVCGVEVCCLLECNTIHGDIVLLGFDLSIIYYYYAQALFQNTFFLSILHSNLVLRRCCFCCCCCCHYCCAQFLPYSSNQMYIWFRHNHFLFCCWRSLLLIFSVGLD